MSGPIRVLLADDSELCVAALERALADRRFTVVARASDGGQAVRAARTLHPDLVIMDLTMPGMDGLTAIEHIMCSEPTPIVVLTGHPGARGGELACEALRRGAVDLLVKDDVIREGAAVDRFRDHLAFLSTVTVVRHLSPRRPALPRGRSVGGARSTIALVASTGGPAALARILGGLPRDLSAAVLVVQHLPSSFVGAFASWLDKSCSLSVAIARDRDRLEHGSVFVAPDAHHLTVRGGRVHLQTPVGAGGVCPSGDVLLSSLAKEAPRDVVAVVLTGMGRDGAEGLHALRCAGGQTYVQDEATSVVYGMPRAAVERDEAHRALALDEVARELARCVQQRGVTA